MNARLGGLAVACVVVAAIWFPMEYAFRPNHAAIAERRGYTDVRIVETRTNGAEPIYTFEGKAKNSTPVRGYISGGRVIAVHAFTSETPSPLPR